MAVLCVLGAAELLLRLGPVAALLPPPRIYYTDAVLEAEARIGRLQRAERPVDVLFLGASTVQSGISPILFDSLVAARTGDTLVSYNGALPALPPPAVNLFLEHFYLPRTEPEVVVEGVNLATLQRSDPSQVERTLRRGRMEGAWLDDGPLDRVRILGMENSRLVAYRGLIGSLMESPEDGRRTPPMDARGYEARTSIVDRPERSGFPPYDPGEGPITEEIDAALAALARSARLCRERGIEYVLVRVPEHGRRFDGRGDLFDDYVEALRAFARQEGIRFLDPAGAPPEWADDRLFADGNHMSAAGARRFTRLLAEAWADAGR